MAFPLQTPLHGRGRYGQRHFRSKRLFTVGVAAANSICLTGCGLQPKRRLAAANAINRNGPSCENAVQKRPQAFLNCQYKIEFPLNIARAKRRLFQPEAEPHHGERQAEPAEEGHGAVVAEQARDGRQHEHAVGEGGQLALRALGPVAVVDGHVGHPPAAVHRPDGDLGLYLEAAAHDGHGLHEGAGEGAVARHDVLEGVAVDHLDEPAHQVVAEVVEGPLVLLAVGAVGDAVAHGHVRVVGRQGRDEVAGGLGRVGVVAVDHEVVLGVDVAGNDLHGRCRELALVEDAPHAVLARLPDKLCQLFCRRFLPVGFDGNLP